MSSASRYSNGDPQHSLIFSWLILKSKQSLLSPIDDIFVIWSGSAIGLGDFNFMNCNQVNTIFISMFGVSMLEFLDVQVEIIDDYIRTNSYCKPIATNALLY